jgi:hypothetical protein
MFNRKPKSVPTPESTPDEYAYYHGVPVKVVETKQILGVNAAVIEHIDKWTETVPSDAVMIKRK